MAHNLAPNVAGDGGGTLKRIHWNCTPTYATTTSTSTTASLIINDIPLHEWLNLKIELKSDRYAFTVNAQVKEIWTDIAQKYSGTCSYNALWFGGTSPALEVVTVECENFDPFVRSRLGHASKTWTVEYYDVDGHLATADGSPRESYLITAKIDTPRVVLDDAQVNSI